MGEVIWQEFVTIQHVVSSTFASTYQLAEFLPAERASREEGEKGIFEVALSLR